jgi:hypothetical protein
LFASAARLWKRQQHEHPDHSSQGPPTGSTSFELQPRTAVTPLSSAAYTLSGSSSVGTVPAGLSAHTSLGVLSSTHDPHPHGVASPASASMSQCTRSSGSVSQGTASDALSSQGVLNVSDGAQGSSLSAAAGQQEIQPAPLEPGKPVMGWLRRPSKRASLEAPDVAPGSDSSSSRAPGSPSAVGSSRSGEKDRDEMQVRLAAARTSCALCLLWAAVVKQSPRVLHKICLQLPLPTPLLWTSSTSNVIMLVSRFRRNGVHHHKALRCAVVCWDAVLAGVVGAGAVHWGFPRGRSLMWTHQDKQLSRAGEFSYYSVLSQGLMQGVESLHSQSLPLAVLRRVQSAVS